MVSSRSSRGGGKRVLAVSSKPTPGATVGEVGTRVKLGLSCTRCSDVAVTRLVSFGVCTALSGGLLSLTATVFGGNTGTLIDFRYDGDTED